MAEARNDRMKQMDEVHLANRKCAELEAKYVAHAVCDSVHFVISSFPFTREATSFLFLIRY